MPRNMYAWDMNKFLLLRAVISIVTSTKYKHALFAFGWISLWRDILLYQGTFDPKSRKHRRFCRILGGWWNLSLPHGYAVTVEFAFSGQIPSWETSFGWSPERRLPFRWRCSTISRDSSESLLWPLGVKEEGFGVKKPGKVLDRKHLHTHLKFNSPWKVTFPIRKDCLPVPPLFRGELSNFGGVNIWEEVTSFFSNQRVFKL